TVFRALRRRVWERGMLIGDPGACIGLLGSNASASLAEGARSTVAVGEASSGRGWSSKGASSSDGAKYSGYSGSST
nr:hypothetical protein [Tanacetum cinerariifolium]